MLIPSPIFWHNLISPNNLVPSVYVNIQTVKQVLEIMINIQFKRCLITLNREKRDGLPQTSSSLLQWLLVSLTNLTPLGSNAVVEAEVVDLAVAVLYVQLGKAKVDPVAARHTDLPLTHRVVGVCHRVTQRGQSPTAGAKHTGTTAITCRATQTTTTTTGSGKRRREEPARTKSFADFRFLNQDLWNKFNFGTFF